MYFGIMEIIGLFFGALFIIIALGQPEIKGKVIFFAIGLACIMSPHIN